MEIVVRRAVAEDAPSLARLRWRWQVEEWQKIPTIDQESFVDFFTSWTLDHLSRYAIFVVQVDGRLGGMAWLSLTDRVPSPRRMDRRGGDIQSVYVLPDLRGSGAGAKLIEALIQYARDVELRYLTVHSARDAVGFYEKLGFVHHEQWLALPDDRLR